MTSWFSILNKFSKETVNKFVTTQPKIEVRIITILPNTVIGYISPYPIVVIVTKIFQIQFKVVKYVFWTGPSKIFIENEKVITNITEKIAKKIKGESTIKHLNVKILENSPPIDILFFYIIKLYFLYLPYSIWFWTFKFRWWKIKSKYYIKFN